MPPHASKKRKYPFEFQSSRKSATSPSTYLEPREVVADTPCHGVGKGLMNSQGPAAPPLLPLLVKDKEYAVDTARSIIRDANLDECSKHEIDPPLGDSSLFDMMRICCSIVSPSLLIFIHSLSITFFPFGQGLVRMRALQIRYAIREASVKCLRNHLETKLESLKQFKETFLTLGQEVIELKAKLSGFTH